MSSLDQILLEDIARFCPQPFLAFHQCMSKPEGVSCAEQQAALSKCVRGSVPTFQKIQGICAGKLQAYEACLTINKMKQESCESELKVLRECATSTL